MCVPVALATNVFDAQKIYLHVPEMFMQKLGVEWPPWCLANAANAFAKKDGDQGGPIVPKVRNGLSRTGAGIGNESETTREKR